MCGLLVLVALERWEGRYDESPLCIVCTPDGSPEPTPVVGSFEVPLSSRGDTAAPEDAGGVGSRPAAELYSLVLLAVVGGEELGGSDLLASRRKPPRKRGYPP